MTDAVTRLGAALEGRYRLDRELGQGGMATVYLAHDVKHERDVAIKVLHPDLGAALGGERFLTEIRTTARLQHPHILPLLDSSEADGLLYYVMPLVTGETLRSRLERERQLPIADAVRIAREVASALDYAHRQNVIHRDIKPENILLHDGSALVADFGIALAVQTAGGQRMTQTGLSLGTPQYMSPEQAMGERAIDARSDIYALGAVTYEMLAGDAPFIGSNVQAIVAKVLSEKPTPLHTLRDTVPATVEQAVFTALAKLPADRFASAAEFATALSATSGPQPYVTGIGQPATPARKLVMLLATTTTVAVAAAAWGWLRPSPAATERPVVTRALVSLPDSVEVLPQSLDVSDDGRTISFLGVSRGMTARLYLRAADGIESRAVLTLGSGVTAGAIAPDGSGFAFTQNDSLLMSTPIGTSPALVARLGRTRIRSLYWSGDGHLLIGGPVLLRLPISGGRIDTLLSAATDGSLVSYVQPSLLPDGKTILFTARRGLGLASDSGEVRLLDPTTGRVTPLGAGRAARYVSPGFLVYQNGQGLVARALDLRTRTLSGPTILLASGAFSGDISPNGVGVVSESPITAAQLSMVRGSETPSALSIPAADVRGVRFDRSGRRLVYGSNTGDGRLFVTDLALGTNIPILPNGWSGYDPLWSPDGQRITFHSSGAPGDTGKVLGFDGFETLADGSRTPRQLYRDKQSTAPLGWLPDGKLLARGSVTGQVGGTSDLFVHTFAGDSVTSVPWLRADWDERSARSSPDGRYVAFVSRETGHDEVTVRPYPDPSAGKWVISEDEANDPVWSADGRSLYYWQGPALRVARLRTSPTLSVVSRETVRTDPDYYRSCCTPNYDVSPDGTHIVLARRQPQARKGFVLVTNWGEEIRAKLAGASVSSAVR